MSTVLVNIIKPSSGSEIAVSGTLNVSGTIKAYALETIIHESTTYRGHTKFGNSSGDVHEFTGSIELIESPTGLTISGVEAGSALITLRADQGDDTGSDITTFTVADGGDLTVDCGGDIVLDADGGDITFADAGTGYLKFIQSSGDCIISSSADTKDIIFHGDDSTEVCRIDGSAKSLLMASTKKIEFTDTNAYIHHDGSTGVVIADDAKITLTASTDIILDADGGEVFFYDGGLEKGVLKMDTANKFILSSSVSTNDVYLMSGRDIYIDAAGGQVLIEDDGADHFLFDCDATKFVIYDDQDDGDQFQIQVAQHGATTITTVDDDASAANLLFVVDGLIQMSGTMGVEVEQEDQRTAPPALLIDNNATGSYALEVVADNTTVNVIDVVANALTSGSILNLASNDSSDGIRTLVNLKNDHASANAVTCLYITQDARQNSSEDDANGATVVFETTATGEDASLLLLQNSNADNNGPILELLKSAEGSAADDDICGTIVFTGTDSGDNEEQFAKIEVTAPDVTDDAKNGSMAFTAMYADTATEVARLNPKSYKATADNFMGGFGYTVPVYAAAEDGTLSGSMSGCTVTLADGIDVKLPTPAVGLQYKFVVTGSVTTAATITSTTNGTTAEELMFGIVEVNGAPSSSVLVKYDVLTFVGGTATAGDMIEVTCISSTTTGGNATWLYKAYGDAAGAITAT